MPWSGAERLPRRVIRRRCRAWNGREPGGQNERSTTGIIYLEEVIERNIDKLFLNYDIICSHPFRVMRNADLSIDEDEAEDLLKEIEKQLKKRQWGEAIRLDMEEKADKRLLRDPEKGAARDEDEIL